MADLKVLQPDYYGGKANPYEVFKIIRALKLNFFIGNALKYMVRAGKKDPSKHVEDLEKAVEYIQDEIREVKEQQKLNIDELLDESYQDLSGTSIAAGREWEIPLRTIIFSQDTHTTP